MTHQATVLVTGITGFLGSHIAIQLLNKGYAVRGTMRDLSRQGDIKSIIGRHASRIDQLQCVAADLQDETVWEKLMRNVDYVMHIASPFPRVLPKDEQDLVRPAREGTLHILKAAAKHQIKRVVMTSSSGAITYGKAKSSRSAIYTEEDWTDESNKKDSTPYLRSKTIAEKTAWAFVRDASVKLELATICPSAILGPVLEPDFGTSANIVIKMLDGTAPAIPDIGFEIVDVRSVAGLHILAMEKPQAAGERYIAASGFLSFMEISKILRAHYPERKIPKLKLPDFGVRLYSHIDATLKPVLIDLGVERRLDSSKARKALLWQPYSSTEAVLSCAESVIALGLV